MSAAVPTGPSAPGRPDEVLVRFSNVSKTFRTGSGRAAREVVAVDDVSLDVRRGEIFGVIGYSGAGKSTLVRLINGLEPITSGSLTVEGFEVAGRRETELAPVRQEIGMIFQQFNLFTSRTVAGNVEYPLKRAGWPKEKRRARVAELLEFVGLSARAGNYPEQLSGGQKQRVGIARALATSPKLLLADESTSALDPETTQEVLQVLQRVNRELGITIVIITHEMDVVRAIADRVAVMQDGKVVEHGSTVDIFARPRTETAHRFVSSVLHSEPDAREVERLRRAHRGRLVIVDVGDGVDIGGVLSDGAARGVRFTIAYGGISVLQEQSFGSLTFELTGEDTAVQAVVDEMSRITTLREVAA
ncbi:methionine ABC transporter ATP-binding protein [Kocuria rosea subsp. polaris]|uniref:Methionine ABC transporter ATP-binding protein n=1 Tax=Kocuria rosea subsp. polaris TaxID=136273 RepID=A0A0W8IMU2_KOCRO|nr:methionine ABC transporter ATP-binding protein [Kocuria polaris]KUG61142.1 methionine ABC transporter ATP-binding protein [Kocuria polaris]